MGVLKHDWLASEGKYPAFTHAGNHSLTVAEIIANDVFIMTSAGAYTLPAASTAMSGQEIIVQAHAATTVVVAAGFGGAGGSYDTATLIDGEFGMFLCDGTHWFSLNVTAPA